MKLAEIADAAGLPKGVLNVVTGTGAEAGAALTRHPLVSKLAFTGSVPTGRAVMTAAAQDIKAVSLELGGKSPFIVFGDSDLDEAVEWIMFGIFWNQGQVCSATSRIIIDETIYDALVERLVAASRKIAIGNGLEQGVKLGPLVSAAQLEKVQGFVNEGAARRSAARVGRRSPAGFNRGYFFQPTILDQVPDSSRLWREEVFGPVVCLRSFKTRGRGDRHCQRQPVRPRRGRHVGRRKTLRARRRSSRSRYRVDQLLAADLHRSALGRHEAQRHRPRARPLGPQ